jgi:hypothetical protein
MLRPLPRTVGSFRYARRLPADATGARSVSDTQAVGMWSTCTHDKSSSRDVVVRVIAEVRSTSAYTMHYTIVITQNSTCGDNGVDVGPLFYHLLALLPQHVPVCAHTWIKVITCDATHLLSTYAAK